jgi:hypothetical protein
MRYNAPIERLRKVQYPGDLVEQAERTAAMLVNLVRDRKEPFGAVGEAWKTMVSSFPPTAPT